MPPKQNELRGSVYAKLSTGEMVKISELKDVTITEADEALGAIYVRVVRCKDCVYYEELNNNEHYCDAIYRDLHGDDEGVDFEPPQDHFCAYGVRREADG